MEMWIPGVVVRDLGLDGRAGFRVIDTRIVGQVTMSLVSAAPELWDRILDDLVDVTRGQERPQDHRA